MPKDFVEKTIEELIFNNKETISDIGFPSLLPCTIRQFKLPSGRIIDILSYNISGRDITLKVFELKRQEIIIESLVQLQGYCLELFNRLFPYFENVTIEKYLVGAKMSLEAQVVLTQLSDVDTFLYEYSLSGLKFKKFIPYHERTSEQLLVDLIPTKDSAIFHHEILDGFIKSTIQGNIG